MSWKTLSKIEMRNRENEKENFVIQYDGNFYRIQNEFGNISFEFDVSSGYAFVQELNAIINSDIENEINNFLNEQDSNGDSDDRQIDMFDNINKYTKKVIRFCISSKDHRTKYKVIRYHGSNQNQQHI